MKYNEENIAKNINEYIDRAENLIQTIRHKTKNGTITDVEKLKDAWSHKTDMVKILLDFEKVAALSKQLIKSVFDMKQTSQVKCVALQAEYDDLDNQFKTQTDKFEKVTEYSQILDKLDVHMDEWKGEMVRCIKEGVKTEINDEVGQILKDTVPDIEKSVATDVNQQNSLEQIVPKIVEETVSKSDKKWSDFFKSNKEEIKKQTKEAKNQTKMVEKSIAAAKQKQAVENIERQKRVRNIIITNVPESDSNDEKKQTEHDTKYIIDYFNLSANDISTVYRVGYPNKNTHGPRKLVAILASPDIAKEQHNYGRGKPIYQEDKIKHWVNPDLIKEDRVANFNARQSRRDQKEKHSMGGQNSDSHPEYFRK